VKPQAQQAYDLSMNKPDSHLPRITQPADPFAPDVRFEFTQSNVERLFHDLNRVLSILGDNDSYEYDPSDQRAIERLSSLTRTLEPLVDGRQEEDLPA